PMSFRVSPLLWAFAAAHVVGGVYVSWQGAANGFDEDWFLAAFVGPLLVVNGIGIAFRREPFDRKLSRTIAWLLQWSGVLGLVIGAFFVRDAVEGAWNTVMLSALVAAWGLAFGRTLDRHEAIFAANA